ncbi:hypothetical protein R6Q59_010508 [Mikania micrantha]|uniref:Uncharacterized protein n=1 Tax=Mikania micrantha TaxID=192012 RepID=A0A5N6N782_9ASTR|nr:hypothetical protein E3N88_25732 [Mikania micrantha]
MGSLMAGWDSHIHDPKSVQLERNKSMTKEEIATYWKSKKNEEELHAVLTKASTFSDGDLHQTKDESDKTYNRSNSLPNTLQDSILEEENEEEEREKLFKKHGWWINSRWAFLNEPPVIASETPSRYASQFHVARKHIDDQNYAATNGIRT